MGTSAGLRRVRGQAMVETALVLVFGLVLVTLGAMQAAWWFMESSKLQVALDQAAASANAGIYDEWSAVACRRIGSVDKCDWPTTSLPVSKDEGYLPHASQVAKAAAADLILKTGQKRDLVVLVRYVFEADSARINVIAIYDTPSFLRLPGLPAEIQFRGIAARELEITRP